MLGTTLSPQRYHEIVASAARAKTHWLQLEPAAFRQSYNREPFLVSHRLDEHELFQLEKLKALCRRLPRNYVKHRVGVVPIDTDFDQSLGARFRESLTLDEALDQMEERQAYVVVNNPEDDREYRPVIEGLLGEIARYTDRLDPGMNWYSTYLFITARHSVTPYHMDREMNFLLQIRGTKTVRLWNPSDDEVMTPAQKDELLAYAGEVRPRYHPGLASRAIVVELSPGMGVHHPFIAPHLVRTGPHLSVSLAVTFRTRQSDVWRDAHRLNHSLRVWCGMRPTPVRVNFAVDWTKAMVVRVARRIRAMVHRPAQPSVGSPQAPGG